MADTPSDVVVFRVIGELSGDPGHLLLASPDGRWYDYDIARGTVSPVEPAASWNVDMQGDAEVHIWAPRSSVVA